MLKPIRVARFGPFETGEIWQGEKSAFRKPEWTAEGRKTGGRRQCMLRAPRDEN
jgi:hypothetical protein